MADVTSTTPTTRRGYLSRTELEQYADITITDATEADDRISIAEEIIDAYVGNQCKAIVEKIEGRAAGATTLTLTVQTSQQNIQEQDYFLWCVVEIIGGTGAGQRRTITGSTKAGVVTVGTAWTTTPDTTSFYVIYQLGKFPRNEDLHFYSEQSPSRYYKAIPEAVKRAVAAQVEYMITMGDAFFESDTSDKQSESIGDYSYTNAQSGTGLVRMIAPKAKLLLRGIINRTGRIIV